MSASSLLKLPRELLASSSRALLPAVARTPLASSLLCRRPSRLALLGARLMSARPADPDHTHPVRARKKVTLAHLLSLHRRRVPITMMTAYDFPTALLLSSVSTPYEPPTPSPTNPPLPGSSSSSSSSSSGNLDPLALPPPPPAPHTPVHPPPLQIDMILVGDSLSQVALGMHSTTMVTLDQMIHHSQAVIRALPPGTGPFVVVDLPFGSFEASLEQGIQAAIRMFKEAQVDCVKIEGTAEIIPLVRRLTEIGIPVMPHIGLTPQRAVALSGYKVQGRTASSAQKLLQLALDLQAAGASSILLEAIPSPLAAYVTSRLSIPTIGIGAGSGTSGQVLVLADALGITVSTSSAPPPRFVRRFSDVGAEMRRGVEEYVRAVRERSFPEEGKETYGMGGGGEWATFLEQAERKRLAEEEETDKKKREGGDQ